MHHLFKLFPADKDKGLGFQWQWNSHSCLQGYESVWCVSWVLCASKFRVGNIGNIFMVSRKLIMWIFIAVIATDIGEDVHHGLWGFDIVQHGKWLPLFCRNMLPPSKERMKILPEKKFDSSCPLAYCNMGCYVAFSYLMFMLAGTVTSHSPFRLEILSEYPHIQVSLTQTFFWNCVQCI